MWIEYYDEFENSMPYQYLARNFVQDWEEYCEKHNLTYENAYNHINDYALTKLVGLQTRRNYKTRLRRFVEYVLEKKSIRAEEEDRIILKVTKED